MWPIDVTRNSLYLNVIDDDKFIILIITLTFRVREMGKCSYCGQDDNIIEFRPAIDPPDRRRCPVCGRLM